MTRSQMDRMIVVVNWLRYLAVNRKFNLENLVATRQPGMRSYIDALTF